MENYDTIVWHVLNILGLLSLSSNSIERWSYALDALYSSLTYGEGLSAVCGSNMICTVCIQNQATHVLLRLQHHSSEVISKKSKFLLGVFFMECVTFNSNGIYVAAGASSQTHILIEDVIVPKEEDILCEPFMFGTGANDASVEGVAGINI